MDKLNFRHYVRSFDMPMLTGFTNTHPLPGEKSSYQADPGTLASGVTYGLVARVPNLSGAGKILLLDGLRSSGSQAAGEFVTDPKAAAELVRLFKVQNVRELPDFEVLISTDSIVSSHPNTSIVAFRRLGR